MLVKLHNVLSIFLGLGGFNAHVWAFLLLYVIYLVTYRPWEGILIVFAEPFSVNMYMER
jgi:hypothetical protein